MKRTILITCAVLMIAAVAAAALALMNANALIARYKPELERAASNAMGTKVTISQVDAQIIPETRLKITGLNLAESNGQGLKVKEIFLDLKLLPLLKKQFEIVELAIEAPSLTFIKDSRGVRLEGLPEKTEKEQEAPKPPPPGTGHEPAQREGGGLNLNLQRFSIDGGTVLFKDVEAKRDIFIDAIDVHSRVSILQGALKAQDLSLNAKLNGETISMSSPSIQMANEQISVEKTLIKALGNLVEIKAQIATNGKEGEIQLSAEKLSLESFSPLLPESAKALALKGALGLPGCAIRLSAGVPNAKCLLAFGQVGLRSGAFNISNLEGKAAVESDQSGQRVQSDALSFSVNGEPFKCTLDARAKPDTIEAPKVSCSQLGGTLSIDKAKVGQEQPKPFSSGIALASIDIERALQVFNPELQKKLAGTLSSFTLQIDGALSGDVKRSLRGQGAVDIRNGRLKGVNIPALVLQSVKDIPGIEGSLYASVPEDQRGEINSPDTAIHSLTGHFALADAKLSTKDLEIASLLFTLQASGTVGFDSSLDLKSTILFSKEFSSKLVASKKQLGYVLDAQGRLVIPLTLQGTPPKIIVLPDLGKLMEVGGKRLLEKKAGDLLQDALTGKGKGGKGLKGLLGF